MGVLAEALAIAAGRNRVDPSPLQRRATSPLLTWSPSTGITLAPSEGSFDRNAAALRCISLIAGNLSRLDLLTVVNGELDPRDKVAALWNQGTPTMPYSARVAHELLMARAELTGEAFAYLPRGADGRGDPGGIFPIFGGVEILVDDQVATNEERLTQGPVGFRVHIGATVVNLLPDEVLWIRYPHPLHPWRALAPWRAALGAVESDALASKWQRQELRNGFRPSAVIGLGDLTEEEHKQAVNTFENRVTGPDNAGRSLLVSSAVRPTVQHLGLTPTEVSLIDSRTANADEVMLAFGVNPDLLRPGSTYENRAAAKTALWSDTLVPKLDVIGSEIDRQLQPAVERVTAWDLSDVDALRESTDAIWTRVVTALQGDLITLDEAREHLDLEPLPGGIGQVTISVYRALHGQGAAVPRMLLAGQGRILARAGGRTVRLRRARPVVRVEEEDRTLDAYERHERVGIRAIRALAARQEKAVLQALRTLGRKGGDLPDVTGSPVAVTSAPESARCRDLVPIPSGSRAAADEIFDPVFWTGETVKALEQFLTGAWTEGQQNTARRLGLSFELFDERVLNAMASRLDVLADRVTQTTRAVLEGQILAAGVEAGESVPQLADRIRAVFTDLAEWRAVMIARTETVGGFNAASHEVAAASGLVVARQWLATGDDRTRPSHVRANGERIPGSDGTYSNGLRYPGDPSGPPAETINCRCVELFDVDG